MPIKIGDTGQSDINIGSNAISKVYIGSQLVYQKAVDFTPTIIFISRENTGTQVPGETAILYDVVMTASGPLPIDLNSPISDRFDTVNQDGTGGTSSFGINMLQGDITRTQRIGIPYPVSLVSFDASVSFREYGNLINEQPGNTITVPAL